MYPHGRNTLGNCRLILGKKRRGNTVVVIEIPSRVKVFFNLRCNVKRVFPPQKISSSTKHVISIPVHAYPMFFTHILEFFSIPRTRTSLEQFLSVLSYTLAKYR